MLEISLPLKQPRSRRGIGSPGTVGWSHGPLRRHATNTAIQFFGLKAFYFIRLQTRVIVHAGIRIELRERITSKSGKVILSQLLLSYRQANLTVMHYQWTSWTDHQVVVSSEAPGSARHFSVARNTRMPWRRTMA